MKPSEAVKPSNRGELEITSLNQAYLEQGKLKMEILSKGFDGLDAGTHEALSEATEFVKAPKQRMSLKIACIEEIEFKMGFISKSELKAVITPLLKSDYGEYLDNMLKTN